MKQIMNNNKNSDLGVDEAYQDYLEQQDAPRWYLEKTYPTFYEYFKKRYDKFIQTWENAAELDKLNKKFRDELFVELCRKINYEIEAEYIFKSALIFIEKNGWPKKTPGKKHMINMTIDQLIDSVLELPILILDSMSKVKQNWEGKQKQYLTKLKERSVFSGNPLSKRKGKKIFQYESIAKLIKIFEEDYDYVRGIQKKACELIGCNSNSYSKWINNSEENRNLVMKWREDIPEPVKIMLKEKIEQSLREKRR